MSSLEPRFDLQFCPSHSSAGVPCELPVPHREHAHQGWVVQAGKRALVVWTEMTARRGS